MKAEQRALDAYPPKFAKQERHPNRVHSEKVDTHSSARAIYLRGYHQAEKDNELTWEDLATIEKLGDDFVKHNQTPISDEEFYQEVLKRFNKIKGLRKEL